MKFNRNSVLAVFMTLLVAISAIGAFAGGAMAAQPTVESSSDIDEGTTWVDFNASSDDRKLVEFNNTDAADGALVVWDPDTGETPEDAQKHLELDNSSDEFESTDSGSDSYAFNITADQLETVPMEAGENKSVKFTIANQSDWESDSADLTTLNVTLDNTMERSVMYVGDHQVENEAYGMSHTDEEPTSVLGVNIPMTGEQQTTFDTTRNIDGSNTTVYMYLANDSVQSHYSDNFDGQDSGTWSDDTLAEIGDGDDAAVKAYSDTLPDDLDNDSTALRYDSSGSTDALVLDIGSEYDGDSQVDMSVNSDPGLRALFGAYGLEAFSIGGFSLGLLVLFGSRRKYGGVRPAIDELRS